VPSNPPLILASSSPRRLALLRQIGVEPAAVEDPGVDETPRSRELPRVHAGRLAAAKAAAIAARRPDHPCFVLGADTVVACGRRILPKAEDAATARDCLELLSGRRHRVLGGIAVRSPEGREALRVVTTQVSFKRLSDDEIKRYIDSGEWHGKAGGYAVQGRAAAFIPAIAGSYSNVVGLSLSDTHAMLTGLGYRWA
jgi:septum formation protein